MEYPNPQSIAKVPTNESGMVTTGINEARAERRNANTTRATIARLSISVLLTSLMDRRTSPVTS